MITPRHLSMACRFDDSHGTCEGTVHLGGPHGVIVGCDCPVCRHGSRRTATVPVFITPLSDINGIRALDLTPTLAQLDTLPELLPYLAATASIAPAVIAAMTFFGYLARRYRRV